MSIMDDTTWKQHLAELEAYDMLCTDCDYNYIIHDEHGAIHYCVVTDIYYNKMLKVKKCPHNRVDGVYQNDI